MQIHGLNKSTLLDYPGHLAATIFIGSCNMRCPFCHNASLVLHPNTQPVISQEEVLLYLAKRKNILEGVCITGGEPTCFSALTDFIGQIKSLGYKLKLDTNGTNPRLLKALANNKLIDYVAMDIKNSPEHYSLSCGIQNFNIEPIRESIAFLLSDSLPYEFRTTLVKEHHTEADIDSIGQWISGANVYYLQPFKDSGDLISEGLSAHSKDELLAFQNLLIPYVKHVSIRGVD